MGFFSAVGTCFIKYFTFSGRASRAEYWWWTLFLFVGSILYSFSYMISLAPLAGADIETLATADLVWSIAVVSAFTLLTTIPTLAVTVRRLHDIGRTGVWVLVPWLLNAMSFWGALMVMPAKLSALGLKGVGGDPILGNALMIGGGLGALIVSIKLFLWLLKAGPRGDNFFGPDPRGPGSAADDYVRSYMPKVDRAAKTATPQMSHREEVSAFYKQHVLGNEGSRG